MLQTKYSRQLRARHGFLLLWFLASFLAEVNPCQGQSVAIEYVSGAGSANTDPITIPNPDGGFDIVVTPSININSGSFETLFASDIDGMILDGPVEIRNLSLGGDIDIQLASEIEVFGLPVSVTANLSGPLVGTQSTPASGTLANGTTFVETEPGEYDLAAGPLDCSDSAFGVFCTAIEAGLEIEFPTDQIEIEDTTVPLTAGMFSDLNDIGNSSFSSEFSFSLPIGNANNLELDVQLVWNEGSRQFMIPEPAAALPMVFGVAVVLLRWRSHLRRSMTECGQLAWTNSTA